MVRISTGLLLVAAALLAGCGGSARRDAVPRSLALRLAGESDAVAARLRAGDGCGAAALARRLRRDAGALPQVQRRAAVLGAEIACVSPAPVAARPTTTAAPVRTHVAKHHRPRKPHARHPHRPHGKHHHGHGKRKG
jgi:hypothetical protein